MRGRRDRLALGPEQLVEPAVPPGDEFRFDFVPVGTYTLKIVLPGFRTYESRGIPLGAAQNVRRTYALEVGTITDNVTVTGEAPMVNTLSPEQRNSLETLEVRSLPMINRNITNILDVGSGLTRGEAANNGMAGTRFRLNGLGGSSMNGVELVALELPGRVIRTSTYKPRGGFFPSEVFTTPLIVSLPA